MLGITVGGKPRDIAVAAMIMPLLAAIPCVWLAAIYAEPYLLVVRTLHDLTGDYFPILSIVILYIPACIVFGAVGMRLPGPRMDTNVAAAAVFRYFGAAKFVTLAVLFLGLGWHFIAMAAAASEEVTTITLAEWEKKPSPPTYVHLREYVVATDLIHRVEEHSLLLPLRAAADRAPVVVIHVPVEKLDTVVDPNVGISGMLRKNGVPFEIDVQYKIEGTLAPETYLLIPGKTPNDDQVFGSWLFLGGVVMSIASLVQLGLWLWRQRRAPVTTRSALASAPDYNVDN